MAAKLLIRPYAQTDASAVALVHVQTWQQSYAGIIDEEILSSLEVDAYKKRWQEDYERYKDDSTRGTLVAVTNNEIFGFLSYGPARDDNSAIAMEIYTLNILKPYWGIGVGHTLFSNACAKLRALKARHTYLWVFQNNHHAKKAYLRWGGRQTGMTKMLAIGGQQFLVERIDFNLQP